MKITAGAKRVEVLDPVKDGGVYGSITKGNCSWPAGCVRSSKLRRVDVGDEHLCLGVKCGTTRHDFGHRRQPGHRYLFDKVVKAGGTAFLGETTEIIGAEHFLAKRAANPQVARRSGRCRHREALAKSTGLDIRTINPIPANIKGGLSSLEEKSWGGSQGGNIDGSGRSAIWRAAKGRASIRGLLDGSYSIFAGYARRVSNLVMFSVGGKGPGRPRTSWKDPPRSWPRSSGARPIPGPTRWPRTTSTITPAP